VEQVKTVKKIVYHWLGGCFNLCFTMIYGYVKVKIKDLKKDLIPIWVLIKKIL